MNLIKATIGKFFPTTTTTDEPSTQTDTVLDDQGKEKKTFERSSGNSEGLEATYRVVYSDGCCFANGSSTARAGYGVYWDDNHPWLVRNLPRRFLRDIFF